MTNHLATAAASVGGAGATAIATASFGRVDGSLLVGGFLELVNSSLGRNCFGESSAGGQG